MKLLEGNTGTAASEQSCSPMESKPVSHCAAAAAAASPSSTSSSALSSSGTAGISPAEPSAFSDLNKKNGSTIINMMVPSGSNNNDNNNKTHSSSSGGSIHNNSHGAGATSSSSVVRDSSDRKHMSSISSDSSSSGGAEGSVAAESSGFRCTSNNNNGSSPNNEPAIVFSTEADAADECLEFTESQHSSSVLASINSLRQQRQFCDISLLVGEQEFPAHRAVLAACSPYLFDFLSCLEETSELHPIYKLGREVPAPGFKPLLDFMYTGRLTVPLENVPTVYATARDLKMESATRACADFLSTHLTAANCIGVRRLTKDKAFKETVDEYIRNNLELIINSKAFFGLTEMQVEVVGLDEEITDEVMERRMFSLVLDWAKNNLNDLKPKMDRLVEQVNVLYLDSDNTLRDCAQVEDLVLSSDDEVIQDYKIMARRRSHTTKKDGSKHGKPMKTHGAQPFQKFSLNPEEAVSVAEREWSIIAIHRTSDNAYLAIAVLDGHLMAVSVHVRPQVPNNSHNGAGDWTNCGHTTNGQSSNGHASNGSLDSLPGTVMANSRVSPTTILRKASIIPLANMSTARCAMGAVELGGKLIVCGGYDRGECLQGVEAFDIQTNTWTIMPSMNRARGRLSTAVLDGYIYVCGGSDGWHELACVERFDPNKQVWSYVTRMIKQRSSHGVATLNGKLYCVGGCEGQRSMAECEVYDPATNKWSKIAPLNTARSQACVVAVKGKLLAIGGTDMWNTLSSVEVYSPDTNEWIISSSLNIARRGAGVDLVNGQVVVVGGSDGSQSLVSVEIFDPSSNTWSMGPPLIVPRANLSVVAINGRLFALGGFSGKKFLSSVEWLDLEDMEWFGHTPRELGSSRPGSNGYPAEEPEKEEEGHAGKQNGDKIG
ncbi:influenza virus ns1a-binding protein homolog a-like [Plakobranchus ocellatus]|uniref:Influenza virus ns1a-binding protein homolog a-like n=1 Tax=Plakobranchus ocellatus TaxID=259542 RepID=A0AAV3Z2G0_9GAST|nr:influenza virus ns1a-binding protein homolog a-like [Plakobranchus ocellatus]